MDDCAGNDFTILDVIGDYYNVRVFLKELLRHSDRVLRFVFSEKNKIILKVNKKHR